MTSGIPRHGEKKFYNSLYLHKTNANQAFRASDIAQIYKFPQPSNKPVTVSVISFGGGLFGNVSSSGVLTGGDVQNYWKSLGILEANQPKVIIISVDGAINTPVENQNETSENTMDVSMIGACCPTNNLTILLFIAPNSLSEFTVLLLKATTPITVDGILYTPSIVSISWGAPEINYTQDQLTTINATLLNAANNGINICVATGDEGSSDGVPGGLDYVDFPASSPYVTACGGTNLVCPTLNYSDSITVEKAWSKGGGGISGKFTKPSWQTSGIGGSNRCLPDISLVADPVTGVLFIIGGKQYVFGGTSIVAPAMAAYYACMNTNTFLLPSLYKAGLAVPNSFHDITSGSNGSYTASIGFDLCTGFGSIAGDILTTQLLNVPPPITVPVTGITVNTVSLSMTIGQQASITAVIAPTNATNKSITWLSDKPSVAIVVPMACPFTNIATCDSVGLVTAVANGTTAIRAITQDGQFTTTTSVIVASLTVPVTGVSLNMSSLVLAIGAQAQLISSIRPPNATNKLVQWKSSSSNVTVSNSGIVKAIYVGPATITVTTNDGGFTATTLITVVLPLISILFSPSSVIVYTYRYYQSNLIINPKATNTMNAVYTSSSPNVASVSQTGLIMTISPGNTIIQASLNGKIARLYIAVVGDRYYYSTKSTVQPIKTRTKYSSYDDNSLIVMRR